MDGSLKELEKFEKLAEFTSSGSRPGKGKSVSIADSLDSLLGTLQDLKRQLEIDAPCENDISGLLKVVDDRKKEIDERQKEIYASVNRYGKTLDKKFSNSLPTLEPLFNTQDSKKALERTVMHHFLRTGQFAASEAFRDEAHVEIPSEMQAKFEGLRIVLSALRVDDIKPALEWCQANHSYLNARSSPLEFSLHRSQFMRLLLNSHPTTALSYARELFPPFYATYEHEINRLMACFVYLPLDTLARSPYSDLASPLLHLDLEPMFAKEYCAKLGLGGQVALRVLGDIAGGGALARIEKGKKVMRDRKSEWSRSDELPIEIPVGPENRYHSIFACPVSKEQTTLENPPMMLLCGHVIAKDSLQMLSKSQGRIKCPYCPQDLTPGQALLVTF